MLKTVTNPKAIIPLQTQSGQIVEDVIIGFDAPGDDVGRRFQIEPDDMVNDQLSVPMNQRATFRWVAKDGAEIKVGSEDRLLWEVVSSKGLTFEGCVVDVEPSDLSPPTPPSVWTKGRDRYNNRYIINQSEHESQDEDADR